MYGKMQVLGLTEIIPSTGIATIRSQYAEIFHIQSSSVLAVGRECRGICLFKAPQVTQRQSSLISIREQSGLELPVL